MRRRRGTYAGPRTISRVRHKISEETPKTIEKEKPDKGIVQQEVGMIKK